MQLQQLPQASLVWLLRHFSRLAYFHFVLQIEKQKPPRNGWERGSTKPFSSFAQINFSSHASETNNFSKTTKKKHKSNETQKCCQSETLNRKFNCSEKRSIPNCYCPTILFDISKVSHTFCIRIVRKLKTWA